MVGVGDRVPDPGVLDVLNGGGHVTNVAGHQEVAGQRFGRVDADFGHFVNRLGVHKLDLIALLNGPLLDPHGQDHPAVVIVLGVKDQGLEWRLQVAGRRRDVLNDLF